MLQDARDTRMLATVAPGGRELAVRRGEPDHVAAQPERGQLVVRHGQTWHDARIVGTTSASMTSACARSVAPSPIGGVRVEDNRSAGSNTAGSAFAFAEPSPFSPYRTASFAACATAGAGLHPIGTVHSRGCVHP